MWQWDRWFFERIFSGELKLLETVPNSLRVDGLGGFVKLFCWELFKKENLKVLKIKIKHFLTVVFFFTLNINSKNC
jgi:hypothetical protein